MTILLLPCQQRPLFSGIPPAEYQRKETSVSRELYSQYSLDVLCVDLQCFK